MSFVVHLTERDGRLTPAARGVLGFARAAADLNTMPLVAVLLASGTRTAVGGGVAADAGTDTGSAAGTDTASSVAAISDTVAREAIESGADSVVVVSHPALAGSDAEPVAAALSAAVRELGGSTLFLDFDAAGKELVGRIARRLGAAAVTEVTGFARDAAGMTWARPVYGGKATAHCRATRPLVVVGVRSRSQPPAAADPARTGEIRTLAPEALPPGRTRVVSRVVAEGPRLEDARVIVSGGRGVGGAGGFAMLRPLAELLGGALGASRAACDAGWVSSSYQIGQTGALVAPDLYIAVGISGASQHLAGITGAKTVVAINTDPQAPIFKRADLGVVADGAALVPALEAALRGK